MPVFAADDLLASLRSLSADDLMLPVLVQLAVIVAVARLGGLVARWVGQPAVVGEIIAGLLLGPSLFKAVLPGVWAAVFEPTLPGVPAEVANAAFPKIFQVLAQLGVILLLFLIGLEFHIEHLKVKGWAALAVAGAGVVLPFAAGAGLGPLIHPHLEPHPTAGTVPLLGLTLFLGVALSVTAIPTLGRILLELGITRTRVGTVVLAAAAAADAAVWVLLAAVGPLVKPEGSEFSWAGPGLMLVLAVAFGLILFVIVRPLLGRYLDHALRTNGGQLGVTPLAVLLVGLLLSGLATNRIGISAVFGALLFGAALADRPGLREAVSARLRDVVTTFLLPVFFTATGLRTDLGSLGGLWWVAVAVFVAAAGGKLIGCTLAARLTGFGWKESAAVGALMNTRGLIALVVINIGYDMGVVPKSLFACLVLMAVATTLLAGPLVMLVRQGTELEEPMRASGFARERTGNS